MLASHKFNITSVVFLLFSLFIFSINLFFLDNIFGEGNKLSFNFLAMTLFFLAIFFQILKFLQPSSTKDDYKKKDSIQKFYDLENEYLKINFLTILSEDQKNQIKNELYNTTFSEFKNTLKNSFDDSIKEPIDLVILKKSFLEIKNRLKNEIKDLINRNAVNLGAGVVITFIAIIILSISLDDFYRSIGDPSNKSILELVVAIVPRLSLVILIEIFAYFFLRLYKFGLNDIKYYQNELTNIESKLIAIEVAYITKNEESIKEALTVLVQTERNFILRKGETTVELERAKSESENMQNILKAIPSFLRNKGK